MNLDPKAFFYVLDACSSGRFTDPWYIGAAYVFSRTYGLLAISMSGTAVPFGTDHSGVLYPGLGVGKSFGDTFVDWYTRRVVETCPDWSTSSDCPWGRISDRMHVLLGDPTLRIRNPVGE
jgi:hypothetical protein